ncbi:MAG: hypothetical protein Kow0099_06280 [Candidatus Abyssubacteria bacterium]
MIRKVLFRLTVSLIAFLCTISCTGPERQQDIVTEEQEVIASDDFCAIPSIDDQMAEVEPALDPSLMAVTPDEEQTETEIQSEPEPAIPIVEPRKVEPRKAYVEPILRVKILGDSSAITVKGTKGLTLNFGENVMRVESGSRITFKPRSARISVHQYAVGVATFKGAEYDQALKAAEKWKKEGYTVRLIKAGGPLVQADGSITDTTLYWVALGKFKEQKAAEEFRDKLFRRGVSPWVIDESILNPRGNIELLDEHGTPLVYANSRVTVSSTAPITIMDVPFGAGFWGSGNREDRIFSGPIEIIVDQKGKLTAINELPLEEYVKGIVPVEIRLSAPDEALKAQAIAARTEALAKLGIQHLYDPFDFCASQHCQEFGGLTRCTARTDAAVEATRGKVLMYNNSLIDAVYSANCGGHTENNEDVWSSRPNQALRGVSDLYSNPDSFHFPLSGSQLALWLKQTPKAYCSDPRVGSKKNFRWKVRYSAKEMDAAVNRRRTFGSVKDIKVLRRGKSGRALQIKIVGNRDIAVINKELEIRRVLGGLKSSMFIIEISRDSSGRPTSFTFYGGGWGHGVGMCQAGAEGMALHGFKAPEILKHYFSNAEIKQLYE